MGAGRFIEDPHFHEGYVQPHRRKINWGLVALIAVLVLGVAAVVARVLIFDFAKVPGNGMSPTLRRGDTYLVNRLDARKEPQRGLILVFRNPESRGIVVMQRVTALPGEHLEIRGGKIYINYLEHDIKELVEAPGEDFGPITVPAGSYFMLGDNVNASRDSREFGCVPTEYIIGTLNRRIGEGRGETVRDVDIRRQYR